jgi:hypothetical protein
MFRYKTSKLLRSYSAVKCQERVKNKLVSYPSFSADCNKTILSSCAVTSNDYSDATKVGLIIENVKIDVKKMKLNLTIVGLGK